MSSTYKWKPYKRRIASLTGVMGKFPLGCTVLFRGDPIGVVVGYDEESEEPEVVFRYSSDRQRRSQFSIRSVDYRRAPAQQRHTRDIDKLQFLAICDQGDMHPSITLSAGTTAEGDRFYSICGDELAVLGAIIGIERGSS